MLNTIFIILISAVALVIVCWILAEYWLRSVRQFSAEKISSLSILDRMGFAFEDFCGGVNHKKDFRRMRLEDEMESVPLEEPKKPHKAMATERDDKNRDKNLMKKERKQRIKANM